MPEKVRAKFKCICKTPLDDGAEVVMEAVTSGNPENDSFFKYTPMGQLTMGVVNPIAAEQFEVGKEYYLDFTPAE